MSEKVFILEHNQSFLIITLSTERAVSAPVPMVARSWARKWWRRCKETRKEWREPRRSRLADPDR